MAELKMPAKGKGAAAMLQELNAQHASPQTEVIKEETNVTTLQPKNDTRNEAALLTANETTNETSNAATYERTKKPQTQRRSVSTETDKSRQDRLDYAVRLSDEDDITVVTVRVSARLNEYMDRYVARINQITPKRKYRKQDAILEAFAAFYADHPMPPAPNDDDL